MKRCHKNTFPTREKAMAVGKTVVRMGRATQNRAYFCQRCNGWHLTSMSRREYAT